MARRHVEARRRAADIGVIGFGDLVYRSGAKACWPTAPTQDDGVNLVGHLSKRVAVFTFGGAASLRTASGGFCFFRDGHGRTNSHLHFAAAIHPSLRIVVVRITTACPIRSS